MIQRSLPRIVSWMAAWACLAVALAAPVGALAAPPQGGPDSAARRVVAVGDIHGAFDSLTSILRETGLVDADLRWSGGDAILVQTGDFTDRGPRVRECMDLLMRLQQEAADQGGQVIVLLANHEVMNLVTVYRDVGPTEYAAFADERSERRQEEAWEAWKDVREDRARALGQPRPDLGRDARRAWEAEHPLGFVERMDALGPDGVYGKWLRGLPTAAVVDRTLFMHAGVSPEFAGTETEAINEQIWGELERFDATRREMLDRELIAPYSTINEIVLTARDELARIAASGASRGDSFGSRDARFAQALEALIGIPSWQILAPNGFLWFRGFAMWGDVEGVGPVAEILGKQGVARIVVAHTTQLDGLIKAKFGGSVFLIDTGMLTEHYGGRPSALEIVDGRFWAIYVGERHELSPGVTTTAQ